MPPTPADHTGLPTSPDDPRIDVRRSKRRKRTVSARVEGETVVVLMPAGLPRSEEHRLIAQMLAKLARSGRRRGTRSSDAELMERAGELSKKWLDGRAVPASVRWVPAMSTRWASCSPGSREIRISESLRDVPSYVLDYVVVHELAHLVVPGGHPPEFWQLVRCYPRTERAMGYLEAYSRVLRSGAAGGGSAGEWDQEPGEGVGDLVDDSAE
ncbi:M48 metallopeptidase family protein [Dietzia sp. NPDC055340]